MEKAQTYLVLAIILLLSLMVYEVFGDFSGFGNPTNAGWFNTSWHYRIRLDINSTAVEREDWPIEYWVNFSDRMPDSFDINSTRLFEYTSSGVLMHEVVSQFDIDNGFNESGNAAGTLIFLMNGTTAENETRIYYLYYDSIENGQKEATNYSSNIIYSFGEEINVNTSMFNFFIDTNRADNTSGIYKVSESVYENTILSANDGDRTAEYLEYYNGTNNVTFDLINNYSFKTGPVRLTLTQNGDEILFGDPEQRTNESRVVKKYYIYDIGKTDMTGVSTFMKIEHIVINTAINGIQRNSTPAGAPAFDTARTMSANDYAANSTDPYSWSKAAGSTGLLGIININESGAGNFYATNSSLLGRVGIQLDITEIQVNSYISQKSAVFFGPNSAFGEDEFIKLRNGFLNSPGITEHQPEKWYVDIVPFIEPSIYNRNETMLLRVNLSTTDPYNLTDYINATLDMGTPDTGDDYTIRLYDDGTNNDAVAGDAIFTNIFGIANSASTGEWAVNFTVYGNDSRLLSLNFTAFNVTEELNVTVAVLNPIGLAYRTIFAEIYVTNYRRDNWTSGAIINCSFNEIEVLNKTDHNNGTYSVNFTAPSDPGNFILFCSAINNGNTGNSTDSFVTEAAKTTLMMNATPENITLFNIDLYTNESFVINVNITNKGYGFAYLSNITITPYNGWFSNISLFNCYDISINASCSASFNITAPNGTSPGNYSVNITSSWTNPDNTISTNMTVVNITVNTKMKIDVYESKISNLVGDGIKAVIGNFTIFSSGNDNLVNITFNCSEGTVCQDFNVSFDPANVSYLAMGESIVVHVNVSVPMYYTPGTYNGTVNVSANGVSDALMLEVNVSGSTDVKIELPVSNYTSYNITSYSNDTFSLYANVTVLGMGSAKHINITIVSQLSWPFEPYTGYCANMTMGESCLSYFNITIPNSTQAGSYYLNLTVVWTNPDSSIYFNKTIFNVTVASNPKINISMDEISGNVSLLNETRIGNFTLFSSGNENLFNITFNCSEGTVCQDFNVSFEPVNISVLVPDESALVNVNITVPAGYAAGTYNGTVNITASGADAYLTLFVTVLPSRLWNITPTHCDRSEFPDEGILCEIVISNLGNAEINFTITPDSGNYTSVNVTNFTVAYGMNYTFSVNYNITPAGQGIYNFTYLVTAIQTATPQEMNFSVRLLPYLPPIINMVFLPGSIPQGNSTEIFVNLTDISEMGINFARFNVTRPNGTIDEFDMSLIYQSGNLTQWYAVYPNQTGNTTQNGIYSVYFYTEDNIGNFGNYTTNFTVYKKISFFSTTISMQYYQGDTGRIFYAARGINGSGIQGVNATFTIRDSTGNITYRESWITDAEGTIYPMPSFIIASDSPIGNYTLNTRSAYYDTAADMLVESDNNQTFNVQSRTVTVSGLFADLETAVVWYPDNIMRFGILVYDGEGKPVNATSINLTVNDPSGGVYFSRALMTDGILNPSLNITQQSTGLYIYTHAMASDTPNGMFLAILDVRQDERQTMKMKAFRVASGGPYDVRLELLENEASQGDYLDFVLIIENKGEVSQDVYVQYWVSSIDDIYYTSSEAIYTPANANISFTRSAFIQTDQPLGTYIINARVTYDNDQAPILANKSFIVTSPDINLTTTTTTIPEAPPSPSPSSGAVISQLPRPQAGIMIERYNNEIDLSQGMTKIEYVTIRNTGTTVLYNITLYILGISLDWYTITPGNIYSLSPGNSSVFLIDFKIPVDAKIGEYKVNLLVMAGGESDQKSVFVNIYESIEDVISKEIKKLKEMLDDLNFDIKVTESSGINASNVRMFAEEADKNIKSAEALLEKGETADALQDLADARKDIEDAYDLLDKIRIISIPSAFPWFLVIIIIVLIIIIIVLIILWKTKRLEPVIRPYVKSVENAVNSMKRKSISTEELNREKEKIVRMLSVLESEKKEGIMTENAYKEMKKSMGDKLSKIEKQLQEEKK